MAYGIIKVDTITFTDGGIDKSVSISGLVQNPTFSGNITVTGTISGNTLRGQTISGVTITGTTAQFASGTFTSITGGVATITSGVFASGTAAAPSIAFTGDLNTGIYSPGADQVAISTNGTGRLFVDSSGRLLVGTSSSIWGGNVESMRTTGLQYVGGRFSADNFPAEITLLKSRGASVGTNTIIQNNDVLGNINFLGADGTTYLTTVQISAQVDGTPGTNDMPSRLIFSTTADGASSPTERLRITSDGKVGLGTSAPSQKLSIGNGSMFIQNSSGAAVSDLGITFALDANTQGRIYSPSGKSFAIQAGTAGSLTDALTVDQSGRVGIGTTSPGSALEITGNQQFSDGADRTIFLSENGRMFSIINNNSRGASASELRLMGRGANDFITFRINESERARLDSSGRLGVGTSSPQAIIHSAPTAANGTATPAFIATQGGSGVDTGTSIRIGYGTAAGTYSEIAGAYSGSGTYLDLKTSNNDTTAASTKLRITAGGNVGIGTTSPAESLEVAGNVILDANNANLKIKSGTTGTTGAVNFTFNTDSTVYGSLSLPYDTRTSVGLKLSADAGGYPLTLASNTSHIIFENNSTERARIDSSGRLLVGTSSAYAVASGFSGVTQQIVGSDAASFLRYSADSSAETLWFCKSRNATTGQHTVLQSNDGIARFNFQASDGTNFITAARIDAEVDGTAGANDMPGRLVFSTTADGASSPTERLRITNDGVMCYDQAAPVSYAAAATLVVGDLKNGLVQYTGAAATLTLPTGTLTEGGFSGIYTNMTFEWSVINTGSGTCTIGAGTGHTIVGGATVAAGASGRFASRRTAANTFVSYRLS